MTANRAKMTSTTVPAARVHLWEDPAGISGNASSLLRRYRMELIASAIGTACVFTALHPAPAAFAATWWFIVLIVIRSDLDALLIPDTASLSIAFLGLAQVAAMTALSGQPTDACATELATALARGTAAIAFLWTIRRTFRWMAGYDGLGLGDVKLMGAAGIWLTLQQQAIALELAALAALAGIYIARLRHTPSDETVVPFGAFLAPMTWAVHVVDLLCSAYGQPVP